MLRNYLTKELWFCLHKIRISVKFKIDENISKTVAYLLNDNGHDAETVYFEKIAGIKDEDLIELCKSENRCLITLDSDFSDIKKYPPNKYCGIILLKVISQSKSEVNNLIKRIIPILNTESIASKLWIVDNEKIKIRENS